MTTSATASTVHVTFVDDATGATLGEADLSPSRLPASFAPATVLHLGDDAWEVVRAEPSEVAQFTAQGALRLTLRFVRSTLDRREAVAAQPALFRRPSLCDPLPTPGDARAAASGDLCELPADEWRQIELVATSALDAVTAEFDAIARVAEQARVPRGYRQVHARRAVPEPLAGAALALEAARAAFRPPPRAFDALALAGQDRVVADGFAFRTAAGLLVYGLAPQGRVTVLGLLPDRERRGPAVDRAALAALQRAHGLALVDWCARTVVRPRPATADG